MKPTPAGWPRISAALFCRDPARHIDWLCDAFGFELRLKVEGEDARARAAGARIVAEPELHDYGDDHWTDRSYGAVDPEGHLWWISQRVRGG